MPPSDNAERREHHRLEFPAAVELHPLDRGLLDRPDALRARLRPQLRMLHWLQLENQYAFVRDSALRSQPALAPLIRLMDAKLHFLAGEILVETSLQRRCEPVRMSATAIDFDWPEPIEPGSLCLIRIDPEGNDPALGLPAVVERLDDAGGRESSRVVARFVALTSEETDALASWIVARQARGLSRRDQDATD